VRHLGISKYSSGRTLVVLFQEGNVRSLAFKYVVMLLDVVVSFVTL
jgi:hypothetical protein